LPSESVLFQKYAVANIDATTTRRMTSIPCGSGGKEEKGDDEREKYHHS